ncbi:MAG: 16S rRNA (cytosine(1402)-N(4))-methyltransferase RsmH [Pseudomonadota bacterium]
MSAAAHLPVLLQELLDAVLTDTSGTYVDATFGRGGHSRALLERLAPDATLLVLDRDSAALAEARALQAEDARVQAEHGAFDAIAALASRHGHTEVDGVMFDLGVSSPQLDQAERGFSFRAAGPLDMRMDQSAGQTAADWLNAAPAAEMERVFRDYGEERFARRIAREIERARPLQTTVELATVVAAAQPRPDRNKHAATRVFQAIRIFINDELGQIERALPAAWNLLRPGGRLAVISFHSLEDRLVKRAFRDLAAPPDVPRRLPIREADLIKAHGPRRAKLHKRVKPAAAEVETNPRARSAVLRTVERLA